MAFGITNNLSSLIRHIPLATGIACGTVVGYTLSSSGDLLNNVLIAGSLGASRAAQRILIDKPLIEKNILQHETALNISNAFYQANLGFGVGIGLGTAGADSSLLSGFFKGSLTMIAGIYTEGFPMAAFGTKVIHIDENGNQL